MKSGTRSSFGHTNYTAVYILNWSSSATLKRLDSRPFPAFRQIEVKIHHLKHTRSIISTSVYVVYILSIVHKHSFVWRAIFIRINQGKHQGWMSHFQNWISIKNKIFYFWNGQKHFLSLYVFDTNLLNFYSFFKSFFLTLSFVPFFLSYHFVFCSSSKKKTK